MSGRKKHGDRGDERATDIQTTDDEGYIIAGYTDSGSSEYSNYLIAKLDYFGDIIWQKEYGGKDFDEALSIQTTNDGGYIVAGTTESSDGDVSGAHGDEDGWIIKLNSNGDIEWQKCLGGSSRDYANSIRQTFDGGYIVAGSTESSDGDVIGSPGDTDGWIVKLSNIGDIEWQKLYGGTNADCAYSIQTTNDGGSVVAGITESNDGDVFGNHGDWDAWIMKLDHEGGLEWQKCLGGSSRDYANSIRQTFDGGYIICGGTESNDGNVIGYHADEDGWVVKLSASGAVEWQKCVGGSKYDRLGSIQAAEDGGYIAAGYTKSNDGDVSGNNGGYDAWVVKLSPIGDLEVQKCLGGNYAYSVQCTNEGGFVVAGMAEAVRYTVRSEDCFIVKLSPIGKLIQEDVSDNVFSIVEPELISIDVDMGQVIIGNTKDSLVTGLIRNIGSWKCRIDSIFFRGDDASAFSLISGLPKYIVESGTIHHAEFSFTPTKTGLHQAEIVIITQVDTIIQKIRGEGIESQIAVMCDWIDFGQVFLKDPKDTVYSIIENKGTASISVSKTEIIGPDIDQFEIINGGGSFTLAPGEERIFTLRFKPEYIGKTSTNIQFFISGSGLPVFAQLFGEGIKNESDCDSTGFEYPDFTAVDDIILSGSTGKVEDYIRLTYANTSQAGAIWHEKPVLVGNGFITEFSFRMSSGDNVNTDDGSLPGADGLAFVIQNNEDIQMGLYGGGIGYHGIENSLAVEFDLFQNNSKQIIDFKDPNGNHAAIQKSVDNKVSALHSSWNTVEINEDIPLLKSDGTIYYAKIEYNIEPNVMSVYLDETGELDDPVIVAGGVKLNDIVNLLQDQKAFVGITSATGNAYQIHDLLDWYFCPFPTDITAVENEISRDEITFSIYPNPASESTTIEINNPEYQFISLSITDIFGREVKSLYSGYKTAGSFTFNWNTGGVTDGIYFCRLSLGDENFVKAVVVSK